MGDGSSVPVAIALGTNLGDRDAHLAGAIASLRAFIDDLRVSTLTDTAPFGVDDPQPRYLNAVAVGRTTRSARDLLNALLAIERAHGRVRSRPNASRTLDLDVIFYGQHVIRERDLIVPHPRFRERKFVLAPLAELAPGWTDPVSGKTVADLLAALAG